MGIQESGSCSKTPAVEEEVADVLAVHVVLVVVVAAVAVTSVK